MRNGKYQNKKSGFNVRPLALLLAVVLLVGVSVGGTLAWLTDTTDEVKNTFTDSDINITLTETEREYKMIPGWTIDKDPAVTVLKDSEDCYVFLKVEENGGCSLVEDEDLPMPVVYTFDEFIAYAIDSNNWTALEGYEGVYYCKAKDITADRKIKVLAGDTIIVDDVEYTWGPEQVLVKPTVTKQMMDAFDVNGDGKLSTDEQEYLPSLTFTAYAVQLYKNNNDEFTAAEAWTKAAALSTN